MSAGLVTIVISTHNRPLRLMALLESIQKYFTPEIDELIVVDDSENPIDLSNKFPSLKIRHISLHERVFISKAKNVGWKSSKTEYVFFIDDDNVLAKDTVTQALNAITRSNDAAAVMPAVLYKSRPDLVWVYATPFTNQPPKFNLLGRNLPRNPDLEGRYFATDALPNSCIVRKVALEEVGGFNERLVVNSSMDLSVRLKRRGWKVYAYTGCFIYHDVEPPGKIGWWAMHGAADPKRVRYEIRDWFIIMRIIRGRETFLTLRSVFQSLRFVVPNALAYALRGRSRRELLTALAKGYVEGIVESFRT